MGSFVLLIEAPVVHHHLLSLGKCGGFSFDVKENKVPDQIIALIHSLWDWQITSAMASIRYKERPRTILGIIQLLQYLTSIRSP